MHTAVSRPSDLLLDVKLLEMSTFTLLTLLRNEHAKDEDGIIFRVFSYPPSLMELFQLIYFMHVLYISGGILIDSDQKIHSGAILTVVFI